MLKKRRNAHIVILLAIAIIVAAFLSACSAKYELISCRVAFDGVNGVGAGEYDKQYSAGGATVYFEKGAGNRKRRDEWAETIVRFTGISSENSFGTVPDVYVCDDAMTVFADRNGGKIVVFPIDTDATTAIGWLLWAQSGNAEVPYGVFYGLAAMLTGGESGNDFDISSAKTAGYLTDLQFPIYENDNLTESEREYAREFSRDVVKRLLDGGKTPAEVASIGREELNAFLSGNYGVGLTDFTFYPYSPDYEYKVEQGCFTYYINREFRDLILPETEFDTTYDFLSDWLRDNAATTKITDETFKVRDMPHIDVSLADGLKSSGISGEANADYIKIYSVGAFSHEYVHHALKQTGKHGSLSEVLPELHANTSKYSRKMWYYLCTGKSTTFPYDESIDEKECYQSAIELYTKKSTKPPAADDFDFWLFSDCLAALYLTPGETPLFRMQIDSLYSYIARTYGGEYVMRINDGQTDLGDKTFDEMRTEWYEYLSNFKQV